MNAILGTYVNKLTQHNTNKLTQHDTNVVYPCKIPFFYKNSSNVFNLFTVARRNPCLKSPLGSYDASSFGILRVKALTGRFSLFRPKKRKKEKKQKQKRRKKEKKQKQKRRKKNNNN